MTEASTRRPFVLEEAIAILARTPGTIDALLRGLPPAWISANEGGDSWSAFDVVGHLIHGEETDWMPRAKIILAHGAARPFTKFDRLAQFELSDGLSLETLLDEFAEFRRRNLDDLRSLGLREADLDRPGMHPELGPVTLRQLLATWMAHDLDHVMQIARVLGRQYLGRSRAVARVSAHHQRPAGLARASTAGEPRERSGASGSPRASVSGGPGDNVPRWRNGGHA